MVEKGDNKIKYCLSRSRKTPPMPEPEGSVSPIKVGGKVSRYCKYFGLLARLLTRSHHASGSLCTSDARWTCRPAAVIRACCMHVSITQDPATGGVMLQINPSTLCHFRSKVLWAAGGMALGDVCTLACRLGGRNRNWATVFRFQPNTVLWVDQATPT